MRTVADRKKLLTKVRMNETDVLMSHVSMLRLLRVWDSTGWWAALTRV